MKPLTVLTATLLSLVIVAGAARAQNDNMRALQAHFERVTAARFDTLFRGATDLPSWEPRKQEARRELEAMLWHDLSWPTGPPEAHVTHRADKPAYRVECLVLEAMPGVYVTANLYLPKTGDAPFPVILYQCGHANKNRYKHHGSWFASHGIAVLMMDNIEMGELEFTHHGIYSHAWYHWYSRGFSPLAVELFNARRVLDYLETREDLDGGRIGATGISGGGMTTFFLSAVDERVAAAAPVSGELSSKGWVEQQLSSAHCDCQFPVNSSGMLYSTVGALTAPRPQLMCNSDADRGFPMDAFGELYDKMGEVYALYGASEALDTAIAPGGHADSEPIRLPVYEFFLREFRGIDTVIAEEGYVDTVRAEDLVCLRDGFPLDERLSRIDEVLIPLASPSPLPAGSQAAKVRLNELTGHLREHAFAYFPASPAPFDEEMGSIEPVRGRLARDVEFNSFEDLRVRGCYSLPEAGKPGGKLPAVLVVDHRRGIPVWGNSQPLAANRWGERAALVIEPLDIGSRALEDNLRSFSDDDPVHHMKRQAMVCGTSLDAMKVYDVMRALEFLRSRPEVDPERITVIGKGASGIHGLYAAILDGGRVDVVLESPPASHRDEPVYLEVLRYTDIPEAAALYAPRLKVFGEMPAALERFLREAGATDAIRATLGECLAE